MKRKVNPKTCPTCGWDYTTFHPPTKCQDNIRSKGYGPGISKPQISSGPEQKKSMWDGWGGGRKAQEEADKKEPVRPGGTKPTAPPKPGEPLAEDEFEYHIGMEFLEAIGDFLNDTTHSTHYSFDDSQRADLKRAMDAIGKGKTNNPLVAILVILMMAWGIPLMMYKEDRKELKQGIKAGISEIKEMFKEMKGEDKEDQDKNQEEEKDDTPG